MRILSLSCPLPRRLQDVRGQVLYVLCLCLTNFKTTTTGLGWMLFPPACGCFGDVEAGSMHSSQIYHALPCLRFESACATPTLSQWLCGDHIDVGAAPTTRSAKGLRPHAWAGMLPVCFHWTTGALHLRMARKQKLVMGAPFACCCHGNLITCRYTAAAEHALAAAC